MNVYHDGDTKYRATLDLYHQQWKVRAETFVRGQTKPLIHYVTVNRAVCPNEEDALRHALGRIRPNIMREIAAMRGEDVSLQPDPVIDRAIAEAKARLEREECIAAELQAC